MIYYLRKRGNIWEKEKGEFMRGNAKIPIRKLLKRDIVWLAEHNCKAHNHSYLSHYNCFLREKPNMSPLIEKVGIFDIETTGLQANWSLMLCWCLKEHGKDIIHEKLITKKATRNRDDYQVVKSAVEEIQKYDRIVTWYGTKFDLPYLRSKALYWKIPFPRYKELYHTDLWYQSRSKLKLSSNRLQTVCQYYGIAAKGHPMTPELSIQTQRGDDDARNTVLEHCREDVISTDQCYDLLMDYSPSTKRSI